MPLCINTIIYLILRYQISNAYFYSLETKKPVTAMTGFFYACWSMGNQDKHDSFDGEEESMKNNSTSNIEVKAHGSDKGADDMMKYDAIGSMWLKILGGVALVISSLVGGLAALVHALGSTGII